MKIFFVLYKIHNFLWPNITRVLINQRWYHSLKPIKIALEISAVEIGELMVIVLKESALPFGYNNVQYDISSFSPEKQNRKWCTTNSFSFLFTRERLHFTSLFTLIRILFKRPPPHSDRTNDLIKQTSRGADSSSDAIPMPSEGERRNGRVVARWASASYSI